jgi:hypothetical protein
MVASDVRLIEHDDIQKIACRCDVGMRFSFLRQPLGGEGQGEVGITG